jgi:NtrC-family two-component system sensor histidine kinase KinB
VRARLGPGGAQVLVSVSDNGIGIPRQFQQRIFDRFVVIETRLSAGRGSTGLGLAFCKMIVEAHGGTIWLESEEGQGSTFTFALPVSGGA